MYTVSLKTMGKTHKAEGESVMEALEKIKLRAVAGKSVLIISNGKDTVERVLPHIIARRAFTTIGMVREVALKNLSLIFQGL